MVDITTDEFNEFALKTNRFIPGQSLTENPETPWPWESPPAFVSKDEALEHFMNLILEEERHIAILESLEEGVPVMNLVELILTKSFQEGEINPDLMMLLAEPLAFMIMALGEKADIEVKLIDEDDDDEYDEDKEFESFRELLNSIKEPKDDEDFPMQDKIDKVETPVLDQENEIEAPSLMENPDETPSLMSRRTE